MWPLALLPVHCDLSGPAFSQLWNASGRRKSVSLWEELGMGHGGFLELSVDPCQHFQPALDSVQLQSEVATTLCLFCMDPGSLRYTGIA